jgi:hypothetical protein
MGQQPTLSVLAHCRAADLMPKSPNANTRLRLPMTIIEHLERYCGSAGGVPKENDLLVSIERWQAVAVGKKDRMPFTKH